MLQHHIITGLIFFLSLQIWVARVRSWEDASLDMSLELEDKNLVGTCPNDQAWIGDSTTGHCFKAMSFNDSVGKTKGSWFEASDYCLSTGGLLATIHTKTESEKVYEALQQYDSKSILGCWFGLRRIFRVTSSKDNTGWVWLDRSDTLSETDFLNWGEEFKPLSKLLVPAERCATVSNNGWGQKPCWGPGSKLNCFVCVIPMTFYDKEELDILKQNSTDIESTHNTHSDNQLDLFDMMSNIHQRLSAPEEKSQEISRSEGRHHNTMNTPLPVYPIFQQRHPATIEFLNNQTDDRSSSSDSKTTVFESEYPNTIVQEQSSDINMPHHDNSFLLERIHYPNNLNLHMKEVSISEGPLDSLMEQDNSEEILDESLLHGLKESPIEDSTHDSQGNATMYANGIMHPHIQYKEPVTIPLHLNNTSQDDIEQGLLRLKKNNVILQQYEINRLKDTIYSLLQPTDVIPTHITNNTIDSLRSNNSITRFSNQLRRHNPFADDVKSPDPLLSSPSIVSDQSTFLQLVDTLDNELIMSNNTSLLNDVLNDINEEFELDDTYEMFEDNDNDQQLNDVLKNLSIVFTDNDNTVTLLHNNGLSNDTYVTVVTDSFPQFNSSFIDSTIEPFTAVLDTTTLPPLFNNDPMDSNKLFFSITETSTLKIPSLSILKPFHHTYESTTDLSNNTIIISNPLTPFIINDSTLPKIKPQSDFFISSEHIHRDAPIEDIVDKIHSPKNSSRHHSYLKGGVNNYEENDDMIDDITLSKQSHINKEMHYPFKLFILFLAMTIVTVLVLFILIMMIIKYCGYTWKKKDTNNTINTTLWNQTLSPISKLSTNSSKIEKHPLTTMLTKEDETNESDQSTIDASCVEKTLSNDQKDHTTSSSIQLKTHGIKSITQNQMVTSNESIGITHIHKEKQHEWDHIIPFTREKRRRIISNECVDSQSIDTPQHYTQQTDENHVDLSLQQNIQTENCSNIKRWIPYIDDIDDDNHHILKKQDHQDYYKETHQQLSQMPVVICTQIFPQQNDNDFIYKATYPTPHICLSTQHHEHHLNKNESLSYRTFSSPLIVPSKIQPTDRERILPFQLSNSSIQSNSTLKTTPFQRPSTETYKQLSTPIQQLIQTHRPATAKGNLYNSLQ